MGVCEIACVRRDVFASFWLPSCLHLIFIIKENVLERLANCKQSSYNNDVHYTHGTDKYIHMYFNAHI